jgi:hypothetical protein
MGFCHALWEAQMADGTYLAVFYSNKAGPKWQAWRALSDAERKAKDAIGLPALEAWDEAHKDAIVYPGRPLGKTLQVSDDGSTTPSVNELTAFVVVKAPSLAAAAKLFEGHPHMSIFPCHAVDVMPLLGMETDDEGRPKAG